MAQTRDTHVRMLGKHTQKLPMAALHEWLVYVGFTGSLTTGLIYALWTRWRFFVHDWIAIKWALALALFALTLAVQSPALSGLAGLADAGLDASGRLSRVNLHARSLALVCSQLVIVGLVRERRVVGCRISPAGTGRRPLTRVPMAEMCIARRHASDALHTCSQSSILPAAPLHFVKVPRYIGTASRSSWLWIAALVCLGSALRLVWVEQIQPAGGPREYQIDGTLNELAREYIVDRPRETLNLVPAKLKALYYRDHTAFEWSRARGTVLGEWFRRAAGTWFSLVFERGLPRLAGSRHGSAARPSVELASSS